jgi:hypothetical protein
MQPDFLRVVMSRERPIARVSKVQHLRYLALTGVEKELPQESDLLVLTTKVSVGDHGKANAVTPDTGRVSYRDLAHRGQRFMDDETVLFGEADDGRFVAFTSRGQQGFFLILDALLLEFILQVHRR